MLCYDCELRKKNDLIVADVTVFSSHLQYSFLYLQAFPTTLLLFRYMSSVLTTLVC